MRRQRTRRKLSMTSLIDVIFLLLLFFMLSSTFSRFAEVELAPASGGGVRAEEVSPVFVQLSAQALTVNGQPGTLDNLPSALSDRQEDELPVLVSLRKDVTSQRLTDLLVVLRGIKGVQVTVLGAT